MPFVAIRDEQFGRRPDAQRRLHLHPALTIVVAVAETRADRGEAGFGRRDLPLVVGGGQVAQLGADEQPSAREERPLESQRVADGARRCLHGQVTGDECVVEALVIEDGRAESERRHEPVHRREPVLSRAEVGHQAEASGGLAQIDDQHPFARAVDEIERLLGAPHRAARPLQQGVERARRARPIEHVAAVHGEVVRERCGDAIVDAFEFDAVDHAFADGDADGAARLVEARGDVRERVPGIAVMTLDARGDVVEVVGQRFAQVQPSGADDIGVRQFVISGDGDGANDRSGLGRRLGSCVLGCRGDRQRRQRDQDGEGSPHQPVVTNGSSRKFRPSNRYRRTSGRSAARPTISDR